MIRQDSFLPYEVREDKISPQQLESWVQFIRDTKSESVVETDVKIFIHLFYSLNKEGYADISVQTVSFGFVSEFYTIAVFRSIPDGQKTFEEYASFKGADIIIRDDTFTARRKISL